MMLWSESAKNCTYIESDILTLHGVKIVFFGNSRTLSVISETMVMLNEDCSRVRKLKKLMERKELSESEETDCSS